MQVQPRGRQRCRSGKQATEASRTAGGLGTTRPLAALLLAVLGAGGAASAGAQSTIPTTDPAPTDPEAQLAATSQPTEFRTMTLDELMNLEVTLVSKRPEKLAETASAIQVITGEEIRRSGALTLPEALRLASNLQVARVNAANWAIAARGFSGAPQSNNALSNKLLVMIDGRSVYTPLFGGVFWDMQNVLLEDVDRIEVISGPGGTLWGANAVNGVINVVTKSARETQGVYGTVAAGTFWEQYGAARYGGQVGEDFYYRVYAMGWQTEELELVGGGDANDDWSFSQGGFRTDYFPNYENTLTFQGDLYAGSEGDPETIDGSGGNVMARWTHTFSEDSDLIVQGYIDSTTRTFEDSGFEDTLRTYDIEFQHRFPLVERHMILWGGGYRLADDDTDNVPALAFLPSDTSLDLFNVFVQDEITLVPERWKLTLGTKLEHNDYSGFELQPSARLAWTPAERQTVWAAVSRAVRSPARFDQDVATVVVAAPNDFEAEDLIAYELGYRVRPITPLSLSVATFFHDYDDLRSVNANTAPPPLFLFENDQEAESWGVEISGDLQLAPWWRLRGGYTWLDKDIDATNPAVLPASAAFEANDPHNQVVLQSLLDLPHHFQFDVSARYVDALPNPHVPSYISLDARLAWHYRNLELAVVGQNLLDDQHPEFRNVEIPRSVYGRVTLRW